MNWVLLVILNRIYQTPLLLSAYKALKYVIHATTQTSELYRLCNSTIVNSQLETNTVESSTIMNAETSTVEVEEKTKDYMVIEHVTKDIVYRIDRSIQYSTQLEEEKQQLKQLECEIDDISRSIITKKQFPTVNIYASQVLSWSLNRIFEANQVLNHIEQNIATKYDITNPEHEEKLVKLWQHLKPEEKLESRKSKQWVDLGFQGDDPSTDFRGMGIQGLEDLLYFVEKYPDHSLSALQHASHPVHWYPYAIVGINITKFAYQILESKKLQLYLFQFGTEINNFQEFYCYLFFHFDQFWFHHQPPLSVMDFEAKFLEFQRIVHQDLLLEKVEPLSNK